MAGGAQMSRGEINALKNQIEHYQLLIQVTRDEIREIREEDARIVRERHENRRLRNRKHRR